MASLTDEELGRLVRRAVSPHELQTLVDGWVRVLLAAPGPVAPTEPPPVPAAVAEPAPVPVAVVEPVAVPVVAPEPIAVVTRKPIPLEPDDLAAMTEDDMRTLCEWRKLSPYLPREPGQRRARRRPREWLIAQLLADLVAPVVPMLDKDAVLGKPPALLADQCRARGLSSYEPGERRLLPRPQLVALLLGDASQVENVT